MGSSQEKLQQLLEMGGLPGSYSARYAINALRSGGQAARLTTRAILDDLRLSADQWTSLGLTYATADEAQVEELLNWFQVLSPGVEEPSPDELF